MMIEESKYSRISKEKSRKSLNHSFALFVILSLSLLSAADTVTFGFRTDIDWISIAYIVLIIVALLLGIAFMISRVFAMQQLEAWTKEEFINLLLSAAILVLFTAFAGIADSIASSLASDILYSTTADGSIQYWSYISDTGRWNLISTSRPECPYPCHIYLARGFLGALYEKYGPVIESTSKIFFVSKLFQSATFGMNIDITLWIAKTNFGFGWPSHAELIIYNNILSTVITEYLKIITALKMQEVALVYLTSLAGLLFIIGIVTRSVWFLRKFGGLLVAAGVGLYLIFPMIYVLGWYTIDRSTVTFNEPALNLPDPSVSTDDVISSISGGGFEADLDMLFTSYDSDGRVTRLGLLDALGRAYLSNIVLPILAVFTTIGFIRQFSPMIGGDTEIAGLTRII